MYPDYSPAMLRLFLAGRAEGLGEAEGLTPKAARLKLSWRLRREAGVAAADVTAAFAGTLREAAPRVRLWAALNHFPTDHGVMLTDDGGQAAMGQAATAGRASPATGRNGGGAKAEDSAHG